MKNLDNAFKQFENDIGKMPDEEFFSMLGTSIEELQEKQRIDKKYMQSSQ